MMNMSAPFIARPVATTLLTLGILMAGIMAFMALPVVITASEESLKAVPQGFRDLLDVVDHLVQAAPFPDQHAPLPACGKIDRLQPTSAVPSQ